MSLPAPLFVSQASVRNLKNIAAQKITTLNFSISSSHLSEGVAAAFGFKTHAALRSTLKNHSTAPAEKPSNARLMQRLQQIGYSSLPNNLQLLPELDYSYTPFKRFALRKRKSVRWMAWRNLLVAAINAGIEQRIFGLSPDQNWWSDAKPETNSGCGTGIYQFTFDNHISAWASVTVTSGDEISIRVVLNPRNEINDPRECYGLSNADAYAHGWLERRLGIWIQDGSEDFSCKRTVHERIAAVTIDPIGYSDQGSFIM